MEMAEVEPVPLRDVKVLNFSKKLSSSTEMSIFYIVYFMTTVMILPVYGFLRFFAPRCRTINEDAIQSRIFEKNS